MKYRFRKKDELIPVENPVLGKLYHLSWAHSRGCVWNLIKINENGIIVMRTPKTKKEITAKLSDLRHTRNSQVKEQRNKNKRTTP